jgi:TRAP-type C4-dicarboxylate transport system permease small subunit
MPMPKRRSLVVVVVSLAFLFFLILVSGSFRVVIGESLHGCNISGGKGCKMIIIKWRHGRRKLVNAHLLVLAPLVAQEHVLTLMGVTAPSKHTIEHPQDTIG